MADLTQSIAKMSPWDLRVYKTQLRQRIKDMNPQDMASVFARIQGVPELSDIVGEFTAEAPTPTSYKQPTAQVAPEPLRPFEAPPEGTPGWQQGIHWLTSPLQWLHEEVMVPFGAAVTSPFTPAVPGTEDLPWLQRELAEYEAWEEPTWTMPWGAEFRPTKGIVETLPWLAIPGIGAVGKAGMGGRGIAGALGRVAPKAGRLAPAVRGAGKALEYSPYGLAEKGLVAGMGVVGKGVAKVLPKAMKPTRLVPDLQPIGEAIAIATEPTKLRNLVNVSVKGKQPLKSLGDIIGGRAATAKNPPELALVGRDVLRFEGANKAMAAISTLERLGASKQLFNLTEEGLVASGALKGAHLNTIRTYPQKYLSKLTEQQRVWVEQAGLIQKDLTALLERSEIPIKKLIFEEGGEYAGRRVFAKFDSKGELIDTAFIGRGQPGRPGMKTAMEKTRIFGTAEEAIAQGFRYLPEEEALYYNLLGAYNRVADKQFSGWFLEQVPWRTVAVTGETAEARQIMLGTQASLKQIRNISMRLKNNEPIPGQMLKGIKAYYPEEYAAIRNLVKSPAGKEAEIDSLLKFVRKQELANKEQWDGIRRAFKEARQSAMRPGFTGTMAPDIPAFAGKVFTGVEAKEYMAIIRKELNPSYHRALNAINQVNAVGRYFALAGDVSPFGIQLIFLAGAHPRIYAKAMRGFAKAMFDPEYHSNFLAKHIDTIQRHPGLILTKGGATEMTEAMARGGLLRKGPFKIMGRVLEPFQRGFESSLDTAGIYLAETYEHLATTAARTAQVDTFINEFRGLLNTTRIGISSTQRQLERAVILAPQYNRAIGALLWDIGQGNLRGELARRAMAKGVAGIMAMTVAISYALGENENQIADHLNPLSPDFMTWDIMGQRVGPGSKVRSLLYMFGKITKNPEDAAYHASRFLRGNFSPFLGTSVDLITGKDYIGDPTRDGLPNLTKTILAENLLPIWLQSVALEGGDLAGRATRGLAEFGGMRGYPMGAYGEMKALQDNLAQAKYGMSWDELGANPQYGKLHQMQLERGSPELQALSEKAAEESKKWAYGEQLVWNRYTEEIDRISRQVNSEINTAAKQFEQTGNGSHFRERVNQAFWLKAQMRDSLLESDEFSFIKEYYSKPIDAEALARMSPQDVAYREYNQMMYAPDMYDNFGEYRFDEADRRRQLFLQRYGLQTLNYIEELIGESRVDEPNALKALRQAREILRSYWDIEDQVWAQYPPELRQVANQIAMLERTDTRQAKLLLMRYPQILYARRMIALLRKQLKARSPDMAQALSLFYSY